MKKISAMVMALLLAMLISRSPAHQVGLLDFGRIEAGMTEAEVLVRLGPPDRESFEGYGPGHALVKSYYYFSEPERAQNILTIIRFAGGRVVDKERIYPQEGISQGGQVDLLDFGKIEEGMTEAEVLVRLGPPDRESFEGYTSYDAVLKSYYYFSEPDRAQNITTVITFAGGRVVDKERIYVQ